MYYHSRINFVLFFYCSNFIYIFSNELIQTSGENIATKDKQLVTQELLRRRKILESYLAKSAESQENWVDTYSVHYSPKAANGIETSTVFQDSQANKHSFANNENEISTAAESLDDSGIKVRKSPKVEKSDDVIKYEFSVRNQSTIDNFKILFGIKENIIENKICPVNETDDSANKSTENISVQVHDSSEVFEKSDSLHMAQMINLKTDKFQYQSKEHQQRHKIVNSYKSKFDHTEDWVETYDFILRPNGNEKSLNDLEHMIEKSKSDYSLNSNKKQAIMIDNQFVEFSMKQTKRSFSDCTQVQLYVIRWLKKLSNKLENADYKSISFSLSSESLSHLKELSTLENFDIISIDKFFSNLISDFTIHQRFSWSEYVPSNEYIFYVAAAATIFFFFYSWRRNPFFLIMLCIIIIIFSSILINYHKMYQKKIAEKHHILSSIFPLHCVNTLTENSGLYDHIKEYFRYSWYHEGCKKYYESTMVDSEYELNFLVVIADLVSNIFSSCFYVFAKTLNNCVKIALDDTYFYQKIVIIIIFIFLILIYFNYKIKLPFISLEPTIVGSQAEDVTMPRRNFLKYIFSRSFYQPNKIPNIDRNNPYEVDCVENQTDKLKDDSTKCVTNTQCNTEQTDCESSNMDKNTFVTSEQNVEPEINNVNENITDKIGLTVNKT